MTSTAASNGGAVSSSGQDAKCEYKPEVFSNNQRELLQNKQVWLDAKDKAERLIMAHEQKFMPAIARTLDLLNVLVEVGLKEFQQQQLTFFIDDVLFAVIKNLLEHREYQHEENYLIAERILLKILELIAKNIETDYAKIPDLLVYILDATRTFYSKDVVLRPSVPHTYYPLGIHFVRDENRRAWEESLEVGSIIDCVKIDSTSLWSRARIKTISESMIRTTFLEDESEYRIVVHSSHQIAPLGTRCKDFEWRQSLKIGDEIDASDSQGVWHKSTIIGERFVSVNETSTAERMLVVGFRQYTNGFNPEDPNNTDFVGIESLYDASLSPHSPRIMRLNKISRKEYPPANRFGSKYYPIEADDFLFEEDNKINKIYALHRGLCNSNIVRYVNYFGQIGGFDAIVKRMQKGQADAQPCPLEQIQKYLEAISNIQKIFYIEYGQELIVAIWEALSTSLQSPSEQYLRTYEKERLESIINSLESLLGLAYSGQDKIMMIESLSLSLSLKCYQSDVLKLRIVGLKLICQIIKYVLQQNHKSDENVEMKSKQFIEWLKKNQVIENLYINQIHSELINRSSDFLKFLAEENILPDQIVQDIFQAIDRQDEMTKQGFLKLLGEAAFWFKPELASSVLRNLQKTDRKDLSQQHIDVIYSLVQFKKYPTVIFVTSADETTPTSNSTTTEQTIVNNGKIVNTNAISALWYFYELITSNSFNSFSAELKAKIIEKFCNLISLKDCQSQNLPFLHRCTEDTKKNLQVSFLLQIIKKIIDTYPIVELKNPLATVDEQGTEENSQAPPTKAQIARQLVHENKLIDVILANIHVIKQIYRKRIEIATNLNNASEKRDSLKQFREEVTERIDFIKFINGILTEKIITSDFLEKVWKDIVEDPLDIDERDIFFKWLRELADSKTIGAVVAEVEGFLQRQLLKNNEFIQHLSYDGFLCYKAMFLTINIEQKKLQQVSATASSNRRYQTNSFGAVTSISSGGSDPSANKEENPNIFDYFLISRPQELHGMDLLWEIVYQNENERVVESCLQFLINLHLHFESATPKEVLYQVRFDLISNLVARIRSVLDLSKEAKKVKRVIDILQCLLDESEKKGIGHLTPLIGLVKGETQSLSITNEISFVVEGLKRQDIKIESNKSIIDLKILIASKVGCSWDQVKIVRANSFKQLKDSDNSRTIGEIRFKASENLTIEKRITPMIPEANLLNADGSIAEKPLAIFTGWFAMFANPTTKLMDAEGLAKFIHSCTGDMCNAQDMRVRSTLTVWDSDKDGFLSEADFLAFYKNACQEKKAVVWKNLHGHQYRNDLKLLSEIGEDVQDLDILPRKIIMDNPEFYDLMYTLLDTNELSESVMNLLNRLPASPMLVQRILNLEGVRGTENANWSELLDTKNSFRLLSTLMLIEYFMEDEETTVNNKSSDASSEEAVAAAAAATIDAAATAASEEQNNEEKKNNSEVNNNQVASVEANSESKKSQEQQNENATSQLKRFYSKNSTIEPTQWREEFISCGGFDQLFQVFNLFSKDNNYSTLPANTKNILSFILRIMKNYLTAVFATKIDHLFKINTYAVQIKYSLDSIDENLKKAEKGETQETKQETDQNQQEQQQSEQKNMQSNSEANDLAAERASGLVTSTPEVTILHPDYFKSNSQGGSGIPGPYNTSLWGQRQLVKEPQEFLQLVEKMRGKLGDLIISTLDITSMLSKLIEIGLSVVSIEGELESEDRGIIDFCCVIILDILLFDPTQRERILTEKKSLFTDFILGGLFHGNLNTRRVFSHIIYLISRFDKSELSAFLLDILMKNVPSSKDVSKSDCNQYYEALCKIIEESKSIVNVHIDFASLMQETIQNVMNHISQEARYNSKNDKMLIGFLNLCEKILKIEPSLGKGLEDFAKYLFNVCLFCKDPEQFLDDELDFKAIQAIGNYDFNPEHYVKCKSSESRKAAYKILISILKSNKQIFESVISEGINVLVDTLRTPSSWSYRPSNEQKCHQNYLGIKNLSQICYMNSMLQQFYMTQTFRYGILAADDKIEPNVVEYRGSYYDDSLLHQIQKMFTYLDLSDRQDYNPTGFCFSFKDYMGQPVNVGVQQDAQEFLNMIFDKLESSLRATPFKYLLESVFGGKTCSQMICSACGNIKSKHELFYTQQLRVEGCKKLSESFLKMIEGETISDFKCDACEKKCDQSRRICFSQLPNILIIQLQRIVFDLDSFVNKKINTRLEFPHMLDLTEYTIEHIQKKDEEAKQSADPNKEPVESEEIPEESEKKTSAAKAAVAASSENQNQYRLKGITVHQGTAELGHYYSYINYKDEKWLEFNDSKIREFNPSNIQTECFGGSASTNSENYWEKGENSKNAYILVYERVTKTPLKIVTTKEEQVQEVEESLSLEIDSSKVVANEDTQEKTTEIDFFSVKQRIPKRLFLDTWLDNHNFMLEKHVYSEEFFSFLKDLLGLVEKPVDYMVSKSTNSWIYPNHASIEPVDLSIYEQTLWMCAKLFFNIFYKAKDFEILKELANQINALIDLVPQFAYKFATEFIFTRFKQIENVLTNCGEIVVRQAYANVIVHTLNALISFKQVDLSTDLAQLQSLEEFNEEDKCELDVLQFLEQLLNIMNTEVAKNWLRMHQYLEIWRDFAHGGDQQITWLFKKEMIARLIDFFLGPLSPLDCFGKKKHEIGNPYVTTPFAPLVQCVTFLISRVKLENIPNKQKFSKNDALAIDNVEFYQKIIIHNYDGPSTCYIGQLLSYKNKQFSESFGRLILRGIMKANFDQIIPYLDIMHSFLMIQDQYTLHRLEWILGFATLKINTQDGYETSPSLEELVVFYETKLRAENVQSVLQIMYHYRTMWENLCMQIIKRVLLLCKLDNQILTYIMRIPAPSHSTSHYLSWIRPHLEGILSSKANFVLSAQKEELAKSTLALYEEIENIINSYAAKNQPSEKSDQETETETKAETESEISVDKSAATTPPTKGLANLWPNYIVGKTVETEEVSCKFLSEDSDGKLVNLREIEYTTKYTDSLPTGKTNEVFPQAVLCGNLILLSTINMKQSNIGEFFVIGQEYQNKSERKNEVAGAIPNAPNLFGLYGTDNANNRTPTKNMFPSIITITDDKDKSEGQELETIYNTKYESQEQADSATVEQENGNNPNVSNADSLSNAASVGDVDEIPGDHNNHNILSGIDLAPRSVTFSEVQSNTDLENKQNQSEKQLANEKNNNDTTVSTPVINILPIENEEKKEQESGVSVQLKENQGQVIRRFVIENNSLECRAYVQLFFTFTGSNSNEDAEESGEESDQPKEEDDSDRNPEEQNEQQKQEQKNQQHSIIYNQFMPQEISIDIPADTSVAVFSTKKINPNKPWSQYKVSYNCELISNNPTVLVQRESSNSTVSVQAANEQEITTTSLYNNEIISDAIGPQLPSSNAASDNEFQKSCPSCTYVQPTFNSFCEICESPF